MSRPAPLSRRSILIVTRHTPLPWEDGAGAYLHDLARFLAHTGFRVEVLWLAPHEDLRWQKIWRLPAAFDSAVHLVLPGTLRWGRRYLFPGMIWYPFKARALHRIRQLLTALDLPSPRRRTPTVAPVPPVARSWMSPPSPGEMALVEHFARRLKPDIVVASYAWMCPLFQAPALRSAQRVCLAHDIAWQRAALAARAVIPVARPELTRAEEAAWLQTAGTLIAISEADATELRALAPAARVLVAPKACELGATPDFSPGITARRLLFVGSGNPFNAEGLGWFLREVWPHVSAAVPGAWLDVCGSIDRAVSLRPAAVTFHGNVPDLAPLYRAAAVVVVPLLRSSGLNIKLVDAAAAGRAIVASSTTLVGAPFLRGAVLAADTAGEFATAVRFLLTDPTANRATAGRAFAAVRTHLNPAVCYGSLATALASPA